MTTSIPSAEQRADELATHIENFAAFLRANPDIADEIGPVRFLVCATNSADPKAEMARVIRRGLKVGATVDKEVNEKFASAYLRFGRISLEVFAQRDQVCERVVIGTHEETLEEPDPEALAAVPTVTKTVTVEDVEWRCQPILAATEEKGEVA